MKQVKNIILKSIFIFAPAILFASANVQSTEVKNLAKMYVIEGDAQKEYSTLVEEEIKKIGFNLTDPHHRVNDQYKVKYGSTKLDVLSFLPAVNDDAVMELLNIDPRLAGFLPFNLLIYKKLTDTNTHVGHLLPEAILDILQITDPEVSKKFIDSFKPLEKMTEDSFNEKGLKYKVKYVPYKNITKQKMFNFEYTFERPDDLDDFIDDFQNDLEVAFTDKEYLIAGYHSFFDTSNGKDVLKGYDAFWTYSLCHLSYSYNIFDNEGARPDAGLYAPCTMYAYIKKGSNKLVLGMPTLANVKNTLNINSEIRVKWLNRLDKEIPEILTSIGMIAVENVNPLKDNPKPLKVDKKEITTTEPAKIKETKPQEKKQIIQNGDETIEIIIPIPPKVPTAVKVITKNSGYINSESIKFSKRIPPNYVPSSQKVKKDNTKADTVLGGINNGKVATYLRGDLIDVKTAQETLKSAGFEILSTAAIDKSGKLISIVFTDKTLQEMANKKDASFMASLRLLINKKEKQISITNPLYMAKAFMQGSYDEKAAKETLDKITSKFTKLTNSNERLKFQLLPKYQFMSGMPYHEDMVTVASGKNLLAKLKDNKSVVFTQTLANGATLIGVNLGKRTLKFTSKIGTKNAALLPYPVLIENGVAKILDPKYYLAVMYPLLKMSEFMKIATVPGAIIRDCEKVFK